MNLKETFRPAKGKIWLTIIIFIVYLSLSLYCFPASFDSFDPENPGPGSVYSCGGAMTPILLAPYLYNLLFLVYLIIIYIVSCLVMQGFDKKKTK